MTTDQRTPTNNPIEDQKPSDAPLTLEATPSGDRAYFCQLLHQKAEVLTFTFGVDGDGPYTDTENQDAIYLAATTVLRVALTGAPLPTDKTLFFVDGHAYYLEEVLLTGTPETLALVRGEIRPDLNGAEGMIRALAPRVVDGEGRPVKLHGDDISAPGGDLAIYSDVLSFEYTKVIARPQLLKINKGLQQVEYTFPLTKHKQSKADAQGRIIYHPPPDWGEEFTDPILGELLKEAHNMDREDLFLYSLIMNELPRHGAEVFRLSLETVRRAKGSHTRGPYGAALAEDLVALHKRLHRLARIAVYVPSNVYISGRYFKGTPFQGGGFINVGHPTAYMPTLPTLAGQTLIPAEWYIQPGPVAMFLNREFGITGTSPQFGIYPEAIFHLDLERRENAFRLALPITQLWRIRSGKANDLERAWKPRNLFDSAGITIPTDRRIFDRWLGRLEKDLEALVDCGLLHSFEWTPGWAADLASKDSGTRRQRGWFDRLLKDGRLILEPHPDILNQYVRADLPGANKYLMKLNKRPGYGHDNVPVGTR